MGDLKNIIYLSKNDYITLYTTGTVTIDGTTLTYDEDNVYLIPESNSGGELQADMQVSIDLGGITTKPLYTAGTSLETILRNLLSPYVILNYSVSGTAAAGTFEYGTSKTISSFTISNITGSVSPTSLVVSESSTYSTEIKSVTNPTATSYNLDSSISLDGTTDETLYFKMSDGTSNVEKQLSWSFVKHIYYGHVSSTTAPTVSTGLSHAASVSSGVSISTSAGEYVAFLSPVQKTSIQQLIIGSWENISTTESTVTFTTSTGASLTYYFYVSNQMIATTETYKLV